MVEGTYSYLTPEGEEVEVAYTANENGYFPSGPGIHPALARALEHFYMRDTFRLPSRRLVSESSILIIVASVPVYSPATSHFEFPEVR